MTKDKWIWMPHAGHLIVAKSCQFHLNTYVGGYIVSTVGEYWPDSRIREITASVRGISIEGRGDAWDADYMKKLGYEEIGCDRLYETMVFKAQPSTLRDSQWQCCPYEVADYIELGYRGYNTASAAYQGHLQMCNEWSQKVDE